jgi:hypothetical protein
MYVTEYNTINVNDIEKALKTSKNRKTPGTDGINTELSKYCNRKLKSRLINLKGCYMEWSEDNRRLY